MDLQLAEEEKGLLLDLVGAYPVLKPSFQPLSKSSDPPRLEVDQAMLEEALMSQKEQNTQLLHRTLGGGKSFRRSGPEWRLALNGQQIEMVLQVLNDVRVGSWENLGCPDPQQEQKLELTETSLRSLFLMEMSGHFQSELLEALDHDASAG